MGWGEETAQRVTRPLSTPIPGGGLTPAKIIVAILLLVGIIVPLLVST